MANSSEHPDLPQPPPTRRRLRLTPYQLVGAVVLIVVPILALSGVFGVTRTTTSVDAEPLQATVEYSSRTRFGIHDSTRVQLTNRGGSTLRGVEARFSRDFLDAQDAVEFSPAVSAITDDWYVVELGDLEAGASQAVIAHYTNAAHWRNNARVAIAAEGGEPSQVDFSVFTFP